MKLEARTLAHVLVNNCFQLEKVMLNGIPMEVIEAATELRKPEYRATEFNYELADKPEIMLVWIN